VVAGPFCRVTFKQLPSRVGAALAALADPESGTIYGHSEEDLAMRVGGADMFRLHAGLNRLGPGGPLEHTALGGGPPRARLEPRGRGSTVRRPPRAHTEAVHLSRFAAARAENGRLIVSAPGRPLVVELAAEATGLLGAFADWRSPLAAAEHVPTLPVDA